jgi:hypothetical protein
VHALELVLIEAAPSLPWEDVLDTEMFAVAVQVEPLCVTVIDFPAIVSVVERGEKLFCPAKIVIDSEPVPVVLLVTLSQGAPGTATELQEEGSVRLRMRIPPLESNATERGLITGS